MKKVISIDNEKYKTLLDTGHISYNGINHTYNENENIYVVRHASVFDSETNTDINYIKNHESLDSAIQKLDEALYNRNTVDYSKNPVIYFGDITSISNQVAFTTTITNFPTSAISDDTFLVLTKPNSFSDNTNKNVLIKISGNSTYHLTEVYRFNKNLNNQDWKPGQSLLMVLRDGRLFVICEYSNPTPVIPYVEVVNNNSSTNFIATVPNVTKLTHGVCVYLKNSSANSATGFTLNVNGLGAKPVYDTKLGTQSSTLFAKNTTYLFIYNENRITGGCWDIYTGNYVDNTDTIGYNIRTNNRTMPVTDQTGRYRLLFTSPDRNHFVPANTSGNATSTHQKAVNQTPIDPFGDIVYYGSTSTLNANNRPASTVLWQQYCFVLGYSFNTTGAPLTLTSYKPVYIKAKPQSDGSAIIDADEPCVQDLPNTEDGYIYIYLGVAYNATSVELQINHPVYCFKNGKVQPWFGMVTDEINELKTKLTSISSANIINGYEYVDLCLPSGNLWATKNFGAEHAWDKGKLIWWGEINASYYAEDTPVPLDEIHLNYCEINGSTVTFSKYLNEDGLTKLDVEDDIVYQTMGEGWNMPSPGDYQELLKCTHQYIFTYNDTKIVAFISNINHNVLFLPIFGFYSLNSNSNNIQYRAAKMSAYASNEILLQDNDEFQQQNYVKCLALGTNKKLVILTHQNANNLLAYTPYICKYGNLLPVRPVHRKPVNSDDPLYKPLTFETNGNFTSFSSGSDWGSRIQFKDEPTGTWGNTSDSGGFAISTKTIMFKSKVTNTNPLGTQTLADGKIVFDIDNTTKYVKISGNVMSLFYSDPEEWAEKTKYGITTENGCANLFNGLFKQSFSTNNNSSNLIIVDASELVIPYPDATGACKNLFKNSYLTHAPKYLYGDNVPQDAFMEAFSECTRLEVAPILVNSYLNASSYRKLFFNDKNLTNVQVSARNLSNNTTDGAENQLPGIDSDSKTSSGWLGKMPISGLNGFAKLSAVAKFNTFEPDSEYAIDYHSSTHSSVNYEINSRLTLQDLVDTIQKH